MDKINLKFELRQNFGGNSKYKEFEINDNTDYRLLSVSGLDTPEREIITTSLSSSEGVSYRGESIKERYITISFDYVGNDKEFGRNEIIETFGRYIDQGTLQVIKGKKIKRIDFFIKSFQVPLNNINEVVNCTIELICPNPFFYVFNSDIATYSGESKILIPNSGTVETGFEMEIVPTSLISVVNFYYSSKFYMKINQEIPVGAKLLINTNNGEKSIKYVNSSNRDTNITHLLENGSTFLKAYPNGGVSAFLNDELINNATIKVTVKPKFWGV